MMNTISVIVLLLMAVLLVVLATTSAAAGGMRVLYDAKGSSCKTADLYGKPVQNTKIDVSAETQTAGTWCKLFEISAKTGYLKAGKKYAIDYAWAHGKATGTADESCWLRFVHSDFDGNRPGGLVCAVAKGVQQESEGYLRFENHGREGCHPVFTSDSPLECWVLVTQAQAGLKYVGLSMYEVTAELNCNEDLNVGYKSNCDDAQTLHTLTPVAGDSFDIKSGRGNCTLKAFEMCGVSACFGQISCTEDVMQPNACDHVSNGENSKVVPYRDVPVPPTTTMVLKISTYVAPA